jgi:DNA-binding MarR family transcriptional regulator|tara:strand:+ start:136 stop:453 length:318 start_codon:yes stop_codon:yes gene_type:complete
MSKQISNEIDEILNRLVVLETTVEKPKMSPIDVLKAISFDDNLTIADRFVMTIIYSTDKITTDLLIDLTVMSPVGLRRIIKKLTGMGYVRKIKQNLYEKAITKIY